MENSQRTLMLALFLALGVVLVTGLIAIPVISEELMNKEMKNQELMLALFIVFGVVLVTGLVVVPVLEADAKCEGLKKNGDACKPKKSKDNV